MLARRLGASSRPAWQSRPAQRLAAPKRCVLRVAAQPPASGAGAAEGGGAEDGGSDRSELQDAWQAYALEVQLLGGPTFEAVQAWVKAYRPRSEVLPQQPAPAPPLGPLPALVDLQELREQLLPLLPAEDQQRLVQSVLAMLEEFDGMDLEAEPAPPASAGAYDPQAVLLTLALLPAEVHQAIVCLVERKARREAAGLQKEAAALNSRWEAEKTDLLAKIARLEAEIAQRKAKIAQRKAQATEERRE